jgi:uncharacterized RDD family membrane protein YckC
MEIEEYQNIVENIDKVLAKRCYAAFIDYLIFFTYFYAYAYYFGEVYGPLSFQINGFGNLFMILCIWFLIFPFMEGNFGYTLGKGLFDLKVVYEDKEEFHWLCSLKRHLLDVVDFPFFGLIGILMIRFGPDHKRVGDYWGKTTVALVK